MSVEAVEAPALLVADPTTNGDQLAEFLREATGEFAALSDIIRKHRDRRARKPGSDTR